MDRKQQLEIRASEIRGELRRLSEIDPDKIMDKDRTVLDDLKQKLGDTEKQIQAAILADQQAAARPIEGSEGRELRALQRQATIGQYVGPFLAGREVEGPALELR